MRPIYKRSLKPLALLLCAIAAWFVAQIDWQHSWRVLIPFVFLLLVLALGTVWGRNFGIAGSMITAAIFAYQMFKPVGSFQVADADARSSVAWMLLAGVSISFLLLPSGTQRPHHK